MVTAMKLLTSASTVEVRTEELVVHGHRTVDISFKNRETLFTYPKNHIF